MSHTLISVAAMSALVAANPPSEAAERLKQARDARFQAHSVQQLAQEAEAVAFRAMEDAYASTATEARNGTAEEEIEAWARFIQFADTCLLDLSSTEFPDSPLLEPLTNKLNLFRSAAVERQARTIRVLACQKKPVPLALKDLFPAM